MRTARHLSGSESHRCRWRWGGFGRRHMRVIVSLRDKVTRKLSVPGVLLGIDVAGLRGARAARCVRR